MASTLLRPTLPTLSSPLLLTTLGVSTGLCLPHLWNNYKTRHAQRLDSSPPALSPKDWSFSQYERDAHVPVVTQRRGGGTGLNARAVRQFSAGSVTGLLAGIGVSLFSKPLAFLLGLLIVGVQTAESYGIHLIPYKRMQRYVTGIDMRSAVQDNVAFKVSFGMMFALSGFANF